jgi:hypothetical protein
MLPHVVELALSQNLLGQKCAQDCEYLSVSTLQKSVSADQFQDLPALAQVQEQVSLYDILVSGQMSPEPVFSFALCNKKKPDGLSGENQASIQGLSSASLGHMTRPRSSQNFRPIGSLH